MSKYLAVVSNYYSILKTNIFYYTTKTPENDTFKVLTFDKGDEYGVEDYVYRPITKQDLEIIPPENEPQPAKKEPEQEKKEEPEKETETEQTKMDTEKILFLFS